MSTPSSASVFSGSIPAYYERHLRPVIFEPYAVDLAARVPQRAGLRVLETACGTGVATRRLLERLPGDGRLVATDLNLAMIELARGEIAADARLEWREADAQALPFDDASFELAVCQFGVMFYPDKVLGLREARRVLVPGGTMVFSVWDSFAANPNGRIADQIVTSLFPEDPPLFYRTPFGWNDHGTILATVEAAGFHDVLLEPVDREAVSESARSFATGLVLGTPCAHAIAQRGGDPQAVIEAVERQLAAECGFAPCRGPMRALVVTATA